MIPRASAHDDRSAEVRARLLGEPAPCIIRRFRRGEIRVKVGDKFATTKRYKIGNAIYPVGSHVTVREVDVKRDGVKVEFDALSGPRATVWTSLVGYFEPLGF